MQLFYTYNTIYIPSISVAATAAPQGLRPGEGGARGSGPPGLELKARGGWGGAADTPFWAAAERECEGEWGHRVPGVGGWVGGITKAGAGGNFFYFFGFFARFQLSDYFSVFQFLNSVFDVITVYYQFL